MARADVRTVDRRVATGTPASAGSEISRVRHAADEYFARAAPDLRVALQAKIIVGLDQHLRINRTVRAMANDATFAHRFVLKDKRARLIAMASSTRLIESPDPEPTGRFHNVRAMRI